MRTPPGRGVNEASKLHRRAGINRTNGLRMTVFKRVRASTNVSQNYCYRQLTLHDAAGLRHLRGARSSG